MNQLINQFAITISVPVCAPVPSNAIEVSINSLESTVKEKIKAFFKELESQGFTVITWENKFLNKDFSVFPPLASDRLAIAERIATTLESQGLSVQRLTSDPNPKTLDRSPTHPVQSFLFV